MKSDFTPVRILVRWILMLFPDDNPEVTRVEMEEAFTDGLRAQRGLGILFVAAEIGALAIRGLQERFESLRHGHSIGGWTDDLTFAVKALARNRGFAFGAVVMLAMGIGLNTAMFSLHTGMSQVVQRFQNPEQLVFLWGTQEGWSRAPVSAGEFATWRDESTAFQAMGRFTFSDRYITGGGDPRRIRAARVSSGLLSMLGLEAEAGRLFGPVDDDPSNAPVAVLSWRFWQERYGGDRRVLGETLLLDDAPHTIVGVLNKDAELESLWWDTSVFSPEVVASTAPDWSQRVYRVVARLADGESVDQASAQLDAIASRLAEARPETNAQVRARIETFEDRFFSKDDRLAMGGLVLGVFAVLLIACVNLANLLLAKGASRRGEMAVRLAMGASRGRMVRQLLSESLILSLVGGSIGIFLGQWGIDLLLAGMPNPPFLREEIGLDPGLFGFSLFVSVSAALTFGLTPALLTSRVSLSEGVKDSRSGSSSGGGRTRLRNGILVTQLSLTVPLVLSCGVSFLNLQALQNVDLGFPREGLLAAEISLPPHRYPEPQQQARFFAEAVETLEQMPGVAHAAAGMTVPIGPGQTSVLGPMLVPGRETSEGAERGPRSYQTVSRGYFETLGVPVRSGRTFSHDDGPASPHVAVVNETFARRYWPEEEAIGKRLLPDDNPGEWYEGSEGNISQPVTIVGVVADHGASFYGEPPGARVYLPEQQHPSGTLLLLLRSDREALQLVSAIRAVVDRVGPGVPISSVRTGEGMLDAWLQESRTIGATLGLMGLLALLMAVLGLYGMVAHSVAQRTFELGVRMVLGADRRRIQASVMKSFVRLSGIGIAIGLVLAGMAGLLARSFLVLLQVSYVPMVLGISGLLLVVVVVAAFIPAYRATSIQPVVALKCE